MPDQRKAGMVGITIYVPRELRETVKERAQQQGETVTAVIVRALKRYAR